MAEQLPALSVNGTFSSDGKTQQNRVEAHAEIAEPGAQTGVDASVLQGKATSIEFRSTTQLANPPRLKKLAGLLSAQGELSTQGSYQVDSRALNARAHADLHGVRQGENRIARLTLDGTVAGVLPHPNAEVRLQVEDALLSGQQLSQARIAARGSPFPARHQRRRRDQGTRAPRASERARV